jgi:hypothetical protein
MIVRQDGAFERLAVTAAARGLPELEAAAWDDVQVSEIGPDGSSASIGVTRQEGLARRGCDSDTKVDPVFFVARFVNMQEQRLAG